ncbi:MAG: amidase family protein, partial [Gammaproteobacteria bacterium]|nr:amidase family protein [Gammaproteobacteria bacterium]
MRALPELFDDYAFLGLPTARVIPFCRETRRPDNIDAKPMDTCHHGMEVVIGGSLAGLPVLNVPVALDPRGRPMRVQVLGPFGADKAVLEFAVAGESVAGHLDVQLIECSGVDAGRRLSRSAVLLRAGNGDRRQYHGTVGRTPEHSAALDHIENIARVIDICGGIGGENGDVGLFAFLDRADRRVFVDHLG